MDVIGFGKKPRGVYPLSPGFKTPHPSPENLALPADFYFLAPVLFRFAPADRPVDEPAQVPQPKLPGRTCLPEGRRAFADFPAGAGFHPRLLFPRRQKKHLALDERRDLPPPLLEALHRADGGSQELRHLLLGFLQPLAEGQEFSGIHKKPRPPNQGDGVIFFLTLYITLCYERKHLF